MKPIILILFLINSNYSPSQKPTSVDSHSKERELLSLINELRTNPKKFLTNNVMPYILENYEDTVDNEYVASLLVDLRKQNPIHPLKWDIYLHDQAHAFAMDMGKTGSTGHYSLKLGAIEKRLKKYANKSEIGENCDYGSDDPLEILMDLLIDEDVIGVGHRRNLLNPHYEFMGIGIESHKVYDWNCVMDFSS